MSKMLTGETRSRIADADPTDLAVAQFLELAKLANVTFQVVDGRLVMRSSRIDWKRWPTVRFYLDQIGIAAITEFFRRNTDEARAKLSAAA